MNVHATHTQLREKKTEKETQYDVEAMEEAEKE